jgi:hypothetical protein
MVDYNVQQFLHEHETWKRLLEFTQSENVFLKNRLAQITKENVSRDLLDEIEYFHNKLLMEDNTIAMLRHDVAEQENWLKREIFEDGAIIKEVRKRQKRLRKEIEIAEQEFNKIKFEFNNFFADKL